MGGFTVYRERKFTFTVSGGLSVQHGNGQVELVLSGKLDGWINAVDVGGERIYEGLVQRNNGIIDISPPQGDLLWEGAECSLFEPVHEKVGYNGTYRRAHGSAFYLGVDHFLELKISSVEARSKEVPHPGGWEIGAGV